MAETAWYMPRKAGEIIAYPWLHRSAVEYMQDLLRPEWQVLEHGSGGSTLWLAMRVAKVVTIEHKLEWREKIRELAPGNVTILASIPDGEQEYDLFFIDGERDERGQCLQAARRLVKPSGWVVLDNANRPEYENERDGLRSWARLCARFDNNIPLSKYFVTEYWRCAPG